jgi:hypothetical protein
VFVVNIKGSKTAAKFLLLATYCGIFFMWDFMSPDHTSLSLSLSLSLSQLSEARQRIF